MMKVWLFLKNSLSNYTIKIALPGARFLSCLRRINQVILVCGYSSLSCSVAKSCPTLCDPMNCSTPGSRLSLSPGVCSNSCPLSRWCRPTISSSVIRFSSSPQSFPPSESFQWVCSLHRVAKVLELQLQHQSFQWTLKTDFLAVQGNLKSLLQHHSSKASILRCSALFIVQLSHPYMTIGKTIDRPLSAR